MLPREENATIPAASVVESLPRSDLGRQGPRCSAMMAVVPGDCLRVVEVEIDHQRQVVGGVAGEFGVGDPDVADG